jgi:hypothetical protein
VQECLFCSPENFAFGSGNFQRPNNNSFSAIPVSNMNKFTKAGLLVLLIGILIYLVFSDGIAGITRAIIIGFLIGIGFVLGGQFGKNT